MASARTQTDPDYLTTKRSIRDALAIALDGKLPRDYAESEAGYRAAMHPLVIAMQPQLQQLRRLSAAGQVSVYAGSHVTHRLFEVLGVDSISSSAIPDDDSWPGIVYVGCVTSAHHEHNRRLASMLARGAIIVTSDKTAAVPGIADGLRVDNGRSSRRGRVAVGPELAKLLTGDSGWSQFVNEMRPAVRLAPGHRPLLREQRHGTQVIARDALTDEPLVILANVGGGQVVHSVPHWWQGVEADSTELGRRPLTSVPAFAALGVQHRDARLGGFGAGSVMLASLLAGLDAALDRAGWWVESHASPTTEGGPRGSAA